MANQPPNFLDMPPELCDPRTARYAVLAIPYEGTVTYKGGTAQGPSAIIEASAHVETFDEELLAEFHTAGVATYPMIPPARDPEEQYARTLAAAREIFNDDKFLLALGGEHSITPPLVAAAAEKHGPISVLQFDAHSDLRDEYEDTKRNHACIMRRVLEITPNIAQVGIRSFGPEDWAEVPERVKNFFTPRRIRSEPDWMDRVLEMLTDRVYVTIDIDGFDPAFAPGTGTPEPGGLDWFQVTGLLRRVCTERTVVGADINEVRPIEHNHATEFLAARLACKIIAYTQLPQVGK